MYSHSLVPVMTTSNAAYHSKGAKVPICQALMLYKVGTRVKYFRLVKPKASRSRGVKLQSPLPSWNPTFTFMPIPKFRPQKAAPSMLDSSVRLFYVSTNCLLIFCTGSDHDSVGIFQQRVSIYGGGDVCKPMDPITSAGYFFNALSRVSGWQSMSIGKAAQAVQRSAFPDRYQERAIAATNICKAGY